MAKTAKGELKGGNGMTALDLEIYRWGMSGFLLHRDSCYNRSACKKGIRSFMTRAVD